MRAAVFLVALLLLSGLDPLFIGKSYSFRPPCELLRGERTGAAWELSQPPFSGLPFFNFRLKPPFR